MTKRSILIVDDERDLLQLLKRSLEPDLSCRIQTAPNGGAALKCLDANTFDLVLADIKMPGMNGLELLEHIKRDTPDLTVVMMTAHGDIEMAVQAIKSGAYDFITKPFDHEALLLRLHWKGAVCSKRTYDSKESARTLMPSKIWSAKVLGCNGCMKPSKWSPRRI